ncbi:hypothetical protein [Streptomyces sp. NPDC058867]|uniref:hypothetical protein n=1 Tax=unclassified Streptomyces TaxID=2593676 RepID=UPI0036B16EAA
MTAVPAEATAAAPPTLARGPHGLLWLTLRVHRTALLSWSALVAVFSGALLWAYGPGDDAARAEYLETGCGAGRPNLGCDMPGPAFERYDYVLGVSGALLAFLPLLAAAWAGGALIGRELEQGTARLAWVQSVPPTRWLAAKLAVPAALLAAGTTATVCWAYGRAARTTRTSSGTGTTPRRSSAPAPLPSRTPCPVSPSAPSRGRPSGGRSPRPGQPRQAPCSCASCWSGTGRTCGPRSSGTRRTGRCPARPSRCPAPRPW